MGEYFLLWERWNLASGVLGRILTIGRYIVTRHGDYGLFRRSWVGIWGMLRVHSGLRRLTCLS
jgi:hypothetical protein